jgi:hypothetical protein
MLPARRRRLVLAASSLLRRHASGRRHHQRRDERRPARNTPYGLPCRNCYRFLRIVRPFRRAPAPIAGPRPFAAHNTRQATVRTLRRAQSVRRQRRARHCGGHRSGNGECAHTGGTGAGCNSEETSPVRIDRRVCGWRAKHAISSGHWRAILVTRVRAGAEVDASPRLAFAISLNHGKDNSRYRKKEPRSTEVHRPRDRHLGAHA